MNQSTFSLSGAKDSAEMGQLEKILSIGTGSFMLLRSLLGKKSILQAIPAGYLLYRGISGSCPVSKMINDKVNAMESNHKVEVKTSVQVDKKRSEVYSFWRKLENLPLFMKHIDSVEVINKNKSKWKMKVFENFGSVEWEAEITTDKKNEMISWQSLPDSQIDNFGQVEFRDGEHSGTIVDVTIKYTAPAGTPGEIAARLLNPLLKDMVTSDLKDFKAYIEQK